MQLMFAYSKNAALEGLEIDQYMWGIVDELSKTEVDEINIDAKAAWKPNSPIITKEEDSKGESALHVADQIVPKLKMW